MSQPLNTNSTPASIASAGTGLPGLLRKKVRRGGRGKAKSPSVPGGGASTDHHAKLNAAMAAGDKIAAKTHALNLANSLHVQAQGTPGTVVQPSSNPDAQIAPDATDIQANSGGTSPALQPTGQSQSGPASLLARAKAAKSFRSKAV